MSGIAIFLIFYLLSLSLVNVIKNIQQNKREGFELHSFDFPDENNGWIKYRSNPVYGDENSGSVFDPFVTEENNKLVMIVSNRKQNSLVKLSSVDGYNWGNQVTLLKRRENTWEHLVNRATFVKKDGVYYLWYTGQSPGVSKIGLAISKDGVHYKRYEQNPVLEATLKSEGVSVMNPHVLWNHVINKFQMWYAAGENYEPDAIFYAESIDGVTWNKLDKPVLTKDISRGWETEKVGGCHVNILEDGTYEMYYIGYQNIHVARICYAQSKDGVEWIRNGYNLLLSPSKGKWDSSAVYKPTVVDFHGKKLMFYNGRKNVTEYIGLAIKQSKQNNLRH